MADLSINQLAELTGKDRRTIASRLEVMDFVPGPKQAHLYDSFRALKGQKFKVVGHSVHAGVPVVHLEEMP